MAKVLMYTSAYCPYCTNAERLLHSKGVTEIEKIQVDASPELKIAMMEKRGAARSLRFILVSVILVALMICVRWIWLVGSIRYWQSKNQATQAISIGIG